MRIPAVSLCAGVLARLCVPKPAPPLPKPDPLEVKVERLEAKNRRLEKRVRFFKRRHRRDVRALNRAARDWSVSVTDSIRLAAVAYGQSSSTLIRKASCESHLWPWAHNPSGAAGLFQFLPSTWRSTPFGSWSIWNVQAQALAASWMHSRGRGGEWSCR